MARQTRSRRIEHLPAYRSFSPDDVVTTETNLITVDEFETLRLLDYEGLTQEACATKMNIARTTVTAIYDSARKKVMDAMVNGKQLLISGGCYEFMPAKIEQDIAVKNNGTERIAVTYEDGEIFQHFGLSKQFKIYDVEDGKIIEEQVIDTNGIGHAALAGFLIALEADILICGGVGIGAKTALADANIQLIAGVKGSADQSMRKFLAGTLFPEQTAGCPGHDGNDGENHNHKKHCCKVD